MATVPKTAAATCRAVAIALAAAVLSGSLAGCADSIAGSPRVARTVQASTAASAPAAGEDGGGDSGGSGGDVATGPGPSASAAPEHSVTVTKSQPAAEVPPDAVEPYVVKGVVRRADGSPLPGATVLAANTLAYNSNVRAVSGADGRYRLELPNTRGLTWQMYAGVDTTLGGEQFHADLAVDPAPFAGADGAIRDVTWQLTGPHADNPELHYGGRVYFYEVVNRNDLRGGFYRVFFAPDGPLIDGSAGEAFVAESGLDEDWIDDVPLGSYEVVVAYIFADERPAVQLAVRPRNVGDYADSAANTFDAERQLMEFDVRAP